MNKAKTVAKVNMARLLPYHIKITTELRIIIIQNHQNGTEWDGIPITMKLKKETILSLVGGVKTWTNLVPYQHVGR